MDFVSSTAQVVTRRFREAKLCLTAPDHISYTITHDAMMLTA